MGFEGAAPVNRLSHVSLVTPNMDAMVHHYTSVLGLSEVSHSKGDIVHLACSDGTPALELRPGDSPSLHSLGFDLEGALDLQSVAKSLEGAGFAPRDWEGPSVSQDGSLSIVDPDGALLQVVAREVRYAATQQPQPRQGVQPVKLGHVASRVNKLKEVIDFYESAMGFRFSDSIGDDFVFMRCNVDHHSVNFLKAGAPRHVHHFAFELQDWAHVKTACDTLWSFKVPLIWGPGRHGPGHNIFTYHRDPDGNIVELFTELDRMTDEAVGVWDWQPWHDGPQRPRKWDPRDIQTNPWGITPPDRFLF